MERDSETHELTAIDAPTRSSIPKIERASGSHAPACDGPDLADIRGLALPRRGLEIMLAGGHNLLLHGPTGVGKSMLARRIPTLLPPLDHEYSIEVSKIHGVAYRQSRRLLTQPPVRMPHHTSSLASLLGGGTPPRPGEVSLANRGVLFLDELPEFSRASLEGLRVAQTNRAVTIMRAGSALQYPADFQLIAAMTRCPCGFLGNPDRVCSDSPAAVKRYQARVSGPFIEHMDLVVPIAPLTAEELAGPRFGESSAAVRHRIIQARARQQERFADVPWSRNADIPASDGTIERLCPTTKDASDLLIDLASRRSLSKRAVDRLRVVARTIADLDVEIGPSTLIRVDAIALAAQLRRWCRRSGGRTGSKCEMG